MSLVLVNAAMVCPWYNPNDMNGMSKAELSFLKHHIGEGGFLLFWLPWWTNLWLDVFFSSLCLVTQDTYREEVTGVLKTVERLMDDVEDFATELSDGMGNVATLDGKYAQWKCETHLLLDLQKHCFYNYILISINVTI